MLIPVWQSRAMLSVCLALLIGLSWPVSGLALDAMASHVDRRTSGPLFPVIWFVAVGAMAVVALNGVGGPADVSDMVTGTFPLDNNFSAAQSVEVGLGVVAGALLTALFRGDLGRAVRHGARALGLQPPRWVSADPERVRQNAWLDCAYLLYADTVALPSLVEAVTMVGHVPADRAARRWGLRGGLSALGLGDQVLERVAEQSTIHERRDFLSALIRLGARLEAIELADIVYLRLIGSRLGLSRAVIAGLMENHGGYASWKGRQHTSFWDTHWDSHDTQGGPQTRRSHTRRGHQQRRSDPPPRNEAACPYGVLGLAPGASLADIKSAYRKLARRYHPDRYAQQSIDPQEAQAITARMAKINAAYGQLKR